MARNRKRQSIRGSVLSGALILVLVAVLGWRLYGLRIQVANARLERDRYQSEVEALGEENAQLTADVKEGATEEKIEEIARYKLGLVQDGEYVFITTGG